MNNNPFEPASADPPTDDSLQTDNAADNFAADDSDAVKIDVEQTTKAPLSIDGISPNYDADMPSGNQAIDDSLASDGILADNDSSNTGDFLKDMVTNDTADKIETTTKPIIKSTENDTLTPPTKVKPDKPVKRVTISLLTIIFFILAIAGIGGTIYFYLENNKNADALADAKAKIQQLEDELSTSATTENTTAGQYDGLNGKIEDLSGKNEENLKTIEDYKKRNEELIKQISTLTTERDDWKDRAVKISDLTSKLDIMLKNCSVTTVGNVQPCSIIIP
ncbi:hypothetical protein FWC31_02025 [Candidatus Saccharibacteria bacterium]|nr:hypothetical protein [Candidatus Saccharibacteria bacterium]